ncbi:zinc finger transcription factor, putative [Plasmodium knowlesi strain H]|uniref:Zinc finger transcription factor, putative n=3 Tax=Plasmodium knowlesi TaxID=5850 RepID=A0A5K1TUT6_PLAKH|nr:C2H2 zinc finger protein Zfp, putative [Plasmodium knowlesi strain H]OTN66764.1 putative Krox-like protein [Plasmodium knowlesi]CAA9990131.1 C2H2 zinc finger protein Zfp, putative [Plasmodium knowlesi strain H]SBO25815.1 zinc finger transcription factor, putative [Plasmodium knowlesi strain H]SBO28604.1 zinc finger transcription factor, putative [Plasmodium knowlesi strain H]VVS79605.1 C2H2 zinc finger protein Zfp, putative [Plasmodium knowlesi strain H]|eukprot:XP_002260598.1 krox-like protein. putative [Plasmodium knowlesi strain H]
MTANFKNRSALCYLDENLNGNSYSESEKNFLKNNINWNKINVLKCNKKENEQYSSRSISADIIMDIPRGNNNHSNGVNYNHTDRVNYNYANSVKYNKVSINYGSAQNFNSNFYSGDASLMDRSVLSKRKYNHLSEEYEERKRKLSPLDMFQDAHDDDSKWVDDDGDGHVDAAEWHANPNEDRFKNKYDFQFVQNYKNVYLNEGASARGMVQGRIPKKQMQHVHHMQQEEQEEGDDEEDDHGNVRVKSQVYKDESTSAELYEDIPNADGSRNNKVEGKYQIDKIYGTCFENIENSFILTKKMKKRYKHFIQNEKKKKKNKKDRYMNESDGNVYRSILGGNRFPCPDDMGMNYALEEEETVEKTLEDEVEVQGEEYFNNTPKNYHPSRETNDMKEVIDIFNGAHEKAEERNKCSDSKNEDTRMNELDGDCNYTRNDERNDHSFESGRLGQQQNSNNDDGHSGGDVHPTDAQSILTEPEKETQFFTPSQTVDPGNVISTFKDNGDESEQDQAEEHMNQHTVDEEKISSVSPYKGVNISIPEEEVNVKEGKKRGVEEDVETNDSNSENGNVLKSFYDLNHVPMSGNSLQKRTLEECNDASLEEKSFPVVCEENKNVEDNEMLNKGREDASPGLGGKMEDANISPVGLFDKQKDGIMDPVDTINNAVDSFNEQINEGTTVEKEKNEVGENCQMKVEGAKENREVNSPSTVVKIKQENCEEDIRKEGMLADSNASTMDNLKEISGTVGIKMEPSSHCEEHYEDRQHEASPVQVQSIPMDASQSGDADKCPKTVGESVSSGTSGKDTDRSSGQSGDNGQSKRGSVFYENMSSKFSRIFGFSSRKVNNNESDDESDSEGESRDRRRYSDDDNEENGETNESDEDEQKEGNEPNDPNEGRTDEASHSMEQAQGESAQMVSTAQLKDATGEGDKVNDEHVPSEGKPGEDNENLQTYEKRDRNDGDDGGDGGDGDDGGDGGDGDDGNGRNDRNDGEDGNGGNDEDDGHGKVGENIPNNVGEGSVPSRMGNAKKPVGTKKVNRRKMPRVKREPLGGANSAEIETRTCNVCSMIFSNTNLMQRHMMSVHSDERPYECDICLKRYKRADHLKLHRIKHDLNKEEKKFQCSICQMFFKSPRQLRNCKLKHIRYSIAKDAIEWATRDQMEGAVNEVGNHWEGHSHEGENDNNGRIVQSGEDQAEGEEHTGGSESGTLREDATAEQMGAELSVQQEEVDQHQMETQGQEAKTKERQIEAHEEQENVEERLQVKKEDSSPNRISVEIRTCHVCSMIFSNKKLMQRHLMSVHSESRPFKCHLCVKTYKRSDHLKNHILTHKDNKEKIKYTCSICQSTFDTPKDLRSHKIRHYTCPYENCSYSYSTISKMKYHLNKHKCNLFYTCPVCAKKFLIYKEFIQHKRGCFEKKYVCLQCNKIYLHSNGYNKHIRKVHLNIIQNYKCTVNNCSREFCSEFSLKEHIINFHHRVKRFFCAKCNMSFGYRSSFRRHNMNIHP